MTACSHCGHENPDGARFCNECGTGLAATDGAGGDDARDVRKTVTVLFCDVVGSTALAERTDPEVLRGMMAAFYAAVRPPVERYGGRVEKVIGDALMAVFGLPAVREDDALRALRAALEMRDAVQTLGDLQARIGVNTGDVLARDATRLESLVVGDAVNVAARLEQAAGPGQVLVGEATWALAGHAARGRPVPPIEAKGKRLPLAAWELEAVDDEAVGQRRRLDLPIVGREQELELLWLTLDRVRRSARPHLVIVIGQPGIGKSRLVAELGRLAGDVTLLTGHCRSMPGRSSLDPLVEALAAVAADEAAVAARMPGDGDAAAVAACLRPGSGSRDVAWASSRLIGRMAADSPVALVIEDVHWADEPLLSALEGLAARGRREALLTVCTARPEFSDRRPGWGGGANTIALNLERLDDLHTRALLARARPGLASDQVDRIVDASEGNPLFAEHLAALVGDGDGEGLPRSIQVLLTARLEALPEREREVLSAAAIVGREFPLTAVEALAGGPVDDEVGRLCGHELLEPTEPGRAQFSHTLLQESAYALIPKARRSELHLQLARWLDDRQAGDAFVGDHLQRAVGLRRELGRDDDETALLAEEAGRRLTAAGRRADALGDPGRARVLLERALELLPAESPGRPAALVELAAAGWNLLSVDEVRGLLGDGAERAAAHGQRALELRARILDLGAMPETGPGPAMDQRTIAETGAALSELERLDDPRATATALTTLAGCGCVLGRAAEGTAYIQRALLLLREIGEDIVWALSILGWTVTESAMPIGEAEALLHRLLEEEGVRPTVRSELLQALAMLAMLAGRDQQAWELYETVAEIEHDLGRRTSWLLRQNSPRMLVRGGRYQQAADLLPASIGELEETSNINGAQSLLGWLALAELRLGNSERAGAAASQILNGRYEAAARGHAVLSEVELAAGDRVSAVEHARRAVEIAARGDWVVLQADTRLALACALAASGDRAGAAAEAGVAAAVSQAKGYAAGVAAAIAAAEPD